MRKVSTVRSIIGYVIIASFSCLRILRYTINTFFYCFIENQGTTLHASRVYHVLAYGLALRCLWPHIICFSKKKLCSSQSININFKLASFCEKTVRNDKYKIQSYRCCDSWPRTFHRTSNQSIRSSTIAKNREVYRKISFSDLSSHFVRDR